MGALSDVGLSVELLVGAFLVRLAVAVANRVLDPLKEWTADPDSRPGIFGFGLGGPLRNGAACRLPARTASSSLWGNSATRAPSSATRGRSSRQPGRAGSSIPRCYQIRRGSTAPRAQRRAKQVRPWRSTCEITSSRGSHSCSIRGSSRRTGRPSRPAARPW